MNTVSSSSRAKLAFVVILTTAVLSTVIGCASDPAATAPVAPTSPATPTPPAPPATAPGTGSQFVMAFNPVTNVFYAADAVAGVVWIIDGTTNSYKGSIPVGNDPVGIAVNSSTNTIYVANVGSHNVSVIDGASNAITATIPVGSEPFRVAVNSTTNLVYVVDADPKVTTQNVFVIDGTTNKVTTGLLLNGNVLDVAVNSTTNTIYTANSTVLTVIDGATDKVTATVDRVRASTDNPLNEPELAVSEATNTVYMTNSTDTPSISIVDGVKNVISGSLPVGSGPCRIAINSITNMVYVSNCLGNSVSAIDGTKNTSTAITLPDNPTGIAVNPTANLIFVEGGTNLTLINGVTNAIVQ